MISNRYGLEFRTIHNATATVSLSAIVNVSITSGIGKTTIADCNAF